MTAMSPRHDQLRTAIQRLSGHDTVPVTYTAPNHTHERNGGVVMARPSTVRRYSPHTETVIVKIARKRAAREVWRSRLDTATAFALIWIAAGTVGVAMLWVVGVLIRWFAVP